MEVVSNSERPHGIQKIIDACEAAKVEIFVACGGAGQLFIGPDKRFVSVLETLPNMDWARPVTDLHMEV